MEIKNNSYDFGIHFNGLPAETVHVIKKMHTSRYPFVTFCIFYTQLPSPVDSTYYNGAMEEVMFDGKPLGLWNFVAGENNFKGAIERSVIVGLSLEL